MAKSTITREQAEEAIDGLEGLISRGVQSVYLDIAIAGLRQLLFAMDQKPALHRFRGIAFDSRKPKPWRYEEFVDYAEPHKYIEDEYFYAEPIVPLGYVMAPASLLSELRDWAHPEIEEYCEMWAGRRDDEFPALRKVIADADALLAAAPQSPGSEPATVPGKWIPVSEQMPPSRHEVLVGCWWGEKPRWCCKWATYIPGHPDAQSSGWLIPGASWTPTHWMPLPARPKESK
ncbi:DUF551 domain-containing protein [Klebsiella variicola]|nr:DUF551 domain-containing protein [Klebsiella variicola]VGP71431.1 hypothetical protein SB5387_01047 [Klebsiella variicola]